MRKCIYAMFLVLQALLIFPSQIHAQYSADRSRRETGPRTLIPALTAEELSVLEAGTGIPVKRFFGKSALPVLVPGTRTQSSVMAELSGINPGIGVETLFLKELPSGFSPETALISMYRILMSVSSMEGIMYFSTSRNKDRILFEKSYRVQGPDTAVRLPDPVPEGIPDLRSIYILQKDSTFGENMYRCTFEAASDSIRLTIENISVLKFGFITAVKPGNMKIAIMIVPVGRHYLFYSAAAAVPSVSMFESRIGESFQNRVIALFNWFNRRTVTQGPE